MNNQGKQSNYHYAKGDIINQSGNFQTGVDKRKTIMGDHIDTQINNSQDLAQAAKDIKDLLNQLSVDYPKDSYIAILSRLRQNFILKKFWEIEYLTIRKKLK